MPEGREPLGETGEWFRLLVESARDHAMILVDPEGRITGWSPGAEAILGPSREEAFGEALSRFWPRESAGAERPDLGPTLDRALREGRSTERGWRVRADGTRIWAEASFSPASDRQGQPLGFSVILTDRTEQRMKEEVQRQGEERFRLLVESVRDYAIFTLDPEGRVASWNAGAERIKGYGPSEIIGQHFSRFYPADAIARGWPEHELTVARREGRFEDEGFRIRKDGSRLWANVIITALRDPEGRLVGFSKITRDLTERRLQEETLRQSEERFRLLVEGVQDYAIFMLDPEGQVMSWNVGAERIMGYSPPEIIGQHFSRFYPADAIARGWPEHEFAVARREGRFEDEGFRIRKDGSRFWANVVITALHDATGEFQGFAKVTRDLTERRRVEALEEEGRRISEFLAMLGHELRNPLASIRNATTVMQIGSEDRARWAREVIDRQVTHLARLVDDLLDLSRITAGKIEVQRERLDLRGVLSRALDTLGPRFGERGQPVEIRLPDDPVWIQGDDTRLSQVVLNLLSNAHKYSRPGGRVWITLEAEARHAEIRIRDEGVGITSDLLPRLFEPFVQGQRTLDRADGGLGLGLSVVRKLVEIHGGTVSASSGGEGLGSVFVVRLPLASGPPDAPKGAPETRDTPQARRVLVVDDNADAADTLGEILSLWGHDVRKAADGPEALRIAAEYDPDLILLDIGLPGLDGYEVARRLRSGRALLVAMTGYGQPEDVLRSRQAGFALHLVKPVAVGPLRALLDQAR